MTATTAVRLLIIDDQLVRIFSKRIRESNFRKQFMYIYLLKNAHAQNGENAVKAGRQAEPPLYDQQSRVYSERTPDLYFDCVGFASEERLDSYVSLQPLEKQLNLPARFIEQRDGQGGQVKVVCQKHQELSGFRVAVNDAAHRLRVFPLGTDPGEPDDLISDDALALRRLGMAAIELQVRFGAGDKGGVSLFDAPEAPEVDVPSVEQVEAGGFKQDRVEPIDIMHFPIGNVDQNWQGSPQIQLGVNLDRRFVLAETGPRENRQAQIDRGRVDRVNRGIQFIDTTGVINAQFAGSGDEQQGKLLEDAAVAGGIGVGQGAARNRAAESEVIELVLTRAQAVLDIAQAFPKGEQRKREGEQVIPRRERRGLVVTAILRDNPSEITLGEEVDDLRKDETSHVHGTGLYRKLGPKRLKSMTFTKYSSYDISRSQISAELKSRQELRSAK